ncbi:hypothetical protein C0J52_04404 [Blattella germanica]|nr:hypothetical protein C0J52_04404 [Blattella germanica]
MYIRVNALKMAFVGPVTVTIRSGHEPSEMLILAPDCNNETRLLKFLSREEAILVVPLPTFNQHGLKPTDNTKVLPTTDSEMQKCNKSQPQNQTCLDTTPHVSKLN